MGKLICVTGLDSSGKGTQVQLIKKYFKKNKIKHADLHFPVYEKNEAGKVISAYLRGEFGDLDKVDPIFVASIYALNRYQYIPELQKLIYDNDVVLLDRYVFCNMAYQGAKYNNEAQSQIIKDWINEYEFGFLELPYPDLNIFFDVPIDIIQKRLSNERKGEDREYLNGKIDIHENNIDYQNKVRQHYLSLKDFENYHIIETDDLSPEKIFKKYEELLHKTLMIP